MAERGAHEGAFALARKALALVRPLLSDGQAGDAFQGFYDVARAEIQGLAADAQRDTPTRARAAEGDDEPGGTR